MSNLKDFAGNELSIGDEVAYIGTHYRHMVSGIVVAFTKHKIRVGHKTYDQRTIDACERYNHPLPTDLREPGYVALIKKANT
jgi:hypothetical protein